MATIELFGETFALRDKVSKYALLKFARAASAGQDSESADGAASMLHLVEKCITKEDWARFDRCMDENDAELDDLISVIKAGLEGAAERPTSLPSDSSDGQTVTAQSSVSSADDKVTALFPGRPDLVRAVRAG